MDGAVVVTVMIHVCVVVSARWVTRVPAPEAAVGKYTRALYCTLSASTVFQQSEPLAATVCDRITVPVASSNTTVALSVVTLRMMLMRLSALADSRRFTLAFALPVGP